MDRMNDLATHKADGRPRARALGIPFQGVCGAHNSIVDVSGVEVGMTTLIRGDGPLRVGHGPVRTGVTAILPRGRAGVGIPVFAGVHSLNGNGEMTGFVWIEECGRTEAPIVLTNTHSVGLARDAVIHWMMRAAPARMPEFLLPVAAETYDGVLNDINGFHVGVDDVCAALDAASAGEVDEGSVGGGTGMICYEFKGGSGTASRVVDVDGHRGVVGAFVQANFGRRHLLTVAGVPLGRQLPTTLHPIVMPPRPAHNAEQGSIIVVVATDLPLLPHQLKRLARRCALGVGRSGAIAGHGSGDIFLAFSTQNPGFFAPAGAEMARASAGTPRALVAVADDALSPVFDGVIQAVDEAIVNALVVNAPMTGRDGNHVPALPHDAVRAAFATR